MPFACYADAFAAYLRSGDDGVFAGLDTGRLQEGGHLAPPEFRGGLARGPDTIFVRGLATVRPRTDRPSVTQAARRSLATVGWGEHLDLAAPDALTVGGYTLTPQYLSGKLEVSRDLANTPGNVGALVAEIEAAANRAEEAAFVRGTGVRQPLGVFTPSDLGVPASRDVVGPLTGLDPFIDALLSLPARHLRSDALRWLLHPLVYRGLLRLKETTGGPIVRPAEGGGSRPTILGVPVELTDDAPAPTGPNGSPASGDYVAAVGDLAAYDVQDGPDFGIQRHNDVQFNALNRVLFIFRRKVDGCPRLPEAFARVKLP